MIDQLSYRELRRLPTTQFPNCFCGLLSICRARPALQLLDARMVCVLSGKIENVVICRAAGVVTRRHNTGRLARQFNDQVQRGRTPNELVLRRGCAHAAANAAFYIRNSNKLNAICCSHCFKEYLKEIDFAVVY